MTGSSPSPSGGSIRVSARGVRHDSRMRTRLLALLVVLVMAVTGGALVITTPASAALKDCSAVQAKFDAKIAAIQSSGKKPASIARSVALQQKLAQSAVARCEKSNARQTTTTTAPAPPVVVVTPVAVPRSATPQFTG